MTSDRTFWIRLAVGVAVLGALAWTDWRRNGPNATRWREYRFLGIVAVGGCLVGVLVDAITVLVSREYFEVAKGLDLGNATWPLWRVVPMGAAAGWTGGLVVGLILLVSNNPNKNPQLPHSALATYVLPPLAAAAALGPIAALLAALHPERLFLYSPLSPTDVEAPGRLCAVWGAHLGVYLGGVAGLVWAVIRIRRRRAAKQAGHFARHDPISA